MGHAVVFIDFRFADREEFLAGLVPGIEVRILDALSAGLDQVAAQLAGRSDVDAIHIVSHGSPGSVALGSSVVDAASLPDYAAQLEAIGRALAPTGDILLYGCSVAEGELGQEFIERFARLTGADVAASSDPTGAARLGGDWQLEASTGPIEASALESGGLEALLAAPVLTRAVFDTSFFGGGLQTLEIGNAYEDEALGVAVQPDGRILVAAATYPVVNDTVQADLAVARFNQDGTLDTSFSGDGLVVLNVGTATFFNDFASPDDEPRAITVQPDGKILIVGYTRNTNGPDTQFTGGQQDILLLRLNANGSLDTAFGGGDGTVVTNVAGGADAGADVRVLADGKILVAASTKLSATSDFALLRYNADGSLDTTFGGGDGIVTTALTTNNDTAVAMEVDASGRIVVAGTADTVAGVPALAVVRYLADGTLDTAFSGDGKHVIDISNAADNLYALAVQADGRILLGGNAMPKDSFGITSTNSVVLRLTAAGALDTSFGGGDGIALFNISDRQITADEMISELIVLSNGQIMAVGMAKNSPATVPSHLFLRLNADGTTDNGGSGLVDIGVRAGNDEVAAMALSPDGTFVTAGRNITSVTDSRIFSEIVITKSFAADVPDQRIRAGLAWQLQFPAGLFSDADGQALTWSAMRGDGSALPSWLAFNATTRTLSGTPTAQDAGTVTIRLKATDTTGLSATENFNLTVTAAPNSAPTLVNAIADQGATQGVAFSFAVPAGSFSDGDAGDALSCAATLADGGALPSWLAFDPGTRTFSGTPSNADVGTLEIRITATDPANASAYDTFVLSVANTNDAPRLATAIPDANATEDAGFSFTLPEGSFSDADSGDRLVYSAALADGGALPGWLAFDAVSRVFSGTPAGGDVGSVTVRVTAIDDAGASASDEFVLAVANTNDAPTGALTITGSAAVGQALTAASTLDDADGMGTIAWQWLADGEPIPGATDASFTPAAAEAGRLLSVRASYADGFGTIETVTSAQTPAVSFDTAPTGAVSFSGPAVQGQGLTVSHTLQDDDGLGAVSYQWLLDGSPLAGATGTSLVLTQAEVGHAVAVAASYIDGRGNATTVRSDAATVANANDLPTGTLSVTGSATQGRTLAVSNQLADLDGLGGFSYQWLVQGEALAGATGTTLTLGQEHVNRPVAVRVSYTDGFGTTETVTSEATPAVQNVNDAPTGAVSIGGTAAFGQTLTAGHGLADADGLGTIEWQWIVGGEALSGATGATYTLEAADLGQPIAVRASYTDGFGARESVTSGTILALTRFELEHLHGQAYHWKSHALLGGVTVQAIDAAAAVASSNALFDLRAGSYDAASHSVALQVWANPVVATGSLDFQLSASAEVGLSFTSALGAEWTAETHAPQPGRLGFGAILGEPDALAVTGPMQIGTLAVTLPAGASAQPVSFLYIEIGGTRVAGFTVGVGGEVTGGDGAFEFMTPVGPQVLAARRGAGDSGDAITSADALAALRLSVGANPHPDPDGAGPLAPRKVSPYQMIAADVNGDARVTSADALAILRMAVKSPLAPAPRWLFVDESLDLWDEAAQKSALTRGAAGWDTRLAADAGADVTLNLVGVLSGDVNGSWNGARASTLPADYFQALATKLGVPVDVWGM